MGNVFRIMCDLIGQQFEGFSIAIFLLFIVVGALLVCGIMMLYEKRSKKKTDRLKKAAYFGLVIYMSFLFQMTYYRREPGSRPGGMTSVQKLLSFLQDGGQMMYQMLNVMLFVPFGGLLTVILKEIRGWRRLLLIISFSYLCSLVIEVTQLLTRRGYFEATDLLMNVLGGAMGCFVAGALLKKHE